jgi:2,5-diamino-6-(ribosylamino)-4(3H)-pyrimidinone 5'-phosphate reductase
MPNRPITTLFLIQSIDGKISTGDTDEMDVDKDFSRIVGVKEGLAQYYDVERKTDRVSLGSGKVQAKVGVNNRKWEKKRDDIGFVIIDNKPHLNESGTLYFAKRSNNFFLVTTNQNHPAFAMKDAHPTMHILFYKEKIDFVDMFRRLKEEFGIDRITIQTGGLLNAEFLRRGLIDHLSIVVAPCLIGGSDTQSLIGGESLHTKEDLNHVKPVKLVSCQILENSYLHLQYDVMNETKIEDI